jgi:hypothetical protein
LGDRSPKFQGGELDADKRFDHPIFFMYHRAGMAVKQLMIELSHSGFGETRRRARVA